MRVVCALFGLALLLGSGVASYVAPFGRWANQIFGQAVWNESDPGAYYFAAAHDLEWGEPALFVGHPGTPLLLLLRGIQELFYGLAAPADLSFSAFISRHLPTAYLLSKLAMTLLHLLSFRLLFLFTRELVRSESAAVFATLGYATSLPVLYYLSRISVEPLMSICFCGAFLAIWRYEALARAGQIRPALGYVGLAAFAAVSGALSKLNSLGPLVPFLVLYLLASGRSAPESERVPARTRWLALLTLLGVGGALAAFYSQWIDWRYFFGFWSLIAVSPGARRGWILAPATPHGVLPLCELLFVALAVAGLVLFLRQRGGPGSRAAWISVYAAYALLLFAYRVAVEKSFLPFNYFFLPNAIAAVYFGVATSWLFRRLSLPEAGPRAALCAVAWALLVHGIAVFAVVESRRYDAKQYAKNRPLFELIAGLATQERVAIPRHRHGTPPPPDLVISTAPWRSERYRIAVEFEALFVPVEAQRFRKDPRRVHVPGLHADFGVQGAASSAR